MAEETDTQVIDPITDESGNAAETVTPEPETVKKEPTVEELQKQIGILQSAKDTGWNKAEYLEHQLEALMDKLNTAGGGSISAEDPDIDPLVAAAAEEYGEGSLPHRLALKQSEIDKKERERDESAQRQTTEGYVKQIDSFFEKNSDSFTDNKVLTAFTTSLSTITGLDVNAKLRALAQGKLPTRSEAEAISRGMEIAHAAAMHNLGISGPTKKGDSGLPKKPTGGVEPGAKNPLNLDVSKLSYEECRNKLKYGA